MKSISTFLMILICMVSFTAGATTTKLEHKQKPDLVKGFTTEINAVSVVNDYQFATVLTVVKATSDILVVNFKSEPKTYLVIITDVGWRSSNQLFNKIFYQERLKEILFTSVNPARYCRINC